MADVLTDFISDCEADRNLLLSVLDLTTIESVCLWIGGACIFMDILVNNKYMDDKNKSSGIIRIAKHQDEIDFIKTYYPCFEIDKTLLLDRDKLYEKVGIILCLR